MAAAYNIEGVEVYAYDQTSADRIRREMEGSPAERIVPEDGATHDIMFVVDCTGSMQRYLQALKISLPQFLQMTRIVTSVGRVGVIAYRDYDCDRSDYLKVVEFSGWGLSMKELGAFVSKQRADGGGDYPEAAKTAARRLLHACSRPCVVMWFTDAPPHHIALASDPGHLKREREVLGQTGFDWVNICRDFETAGHRTFTVVPPYMNPSASCFWNTMAFFTGGNVLSPTQVTPMEIAQLTIGVFIALIGHQYDFGDAATSSLTDPVAEVFKTENACCGFLPSPSGHAKVRMPTAGKLTRDRIEAMHGQNVQEATLLERFRSDSAFKGTVYEIFEYVISPDVIISLTYNTVFGSLWRAISSSREDPRRDKLVDQMGTVVSRLPESTKEALKSFIEMSYDRTSDIEAGIAEAPVPTSYLFIDCKEGDMSRTELLEVSRSCHKGVLARVGGLLTNLRVSGTEPTGLRYLPATARSLFQMLPHLMCAGTMFSRRPAAILAIVALHTHSVLRDQAAAFLKSIKGRWIEAELPENLSVEFCNAVLLAPECLTEEERTRYTDLRRISGLKFNGSTNVTVHIGYTSHKTVRPDDKKQCLLCQQMRSTTLVGGDGVCVLCVCDVGESEETAPEGCSHWCECRACKVHYAVVNTQDLNVEPKCHFCRSCASVEHEAECTVCLNSFLRQDGEMVEAYVCPPCRSDPPQPQTIDVKVRDYLRVNGALASGFRIPEHDAFFDARSLFSARDKAFVTAAQVCETPVWSGKKVHNHEDVLASIEKWIISGDKERGNCMLCFEVMDKKELLRVCGRRGCESVACRSCLDTWYGETKPGQICFTPRLLCPFCKFPPAAKVVKRHNREVLWLRGVETDEAGWYMGWCLSCYHLKRAVEKSCTEAAPSMTTFKCEECVLKDVATAPTIPTKECPGCSVEIQKTSGCNHIQCTCGTHFCWQCGETSGDVYDHMSKQHGGFFGGGGDDDFGYGDEGYDSGNDDFGYGDEGIR